MNVLCMYRFSGDMRTTSIASGGGWPNPLGGSHDGSAAIAAVRTLREIVW